MKNRFRIGISGWTYPGWRRVFYPKGLPRHRELEFASRQVNSIEINGSFYSLQRPESYRRWYQDTPADFVFSVKGGRYITHLKRLHQIESPLANFFASGVLLLEEKLGPILWQFPPSFRFDPEKLENFFRLLPRDTAEAARLARRRSDWMEERSWTTTDRTRPIRHAIEIRNESFQDPAFIELLRRHDVALVVADNATRWPYLEDVTSDFVYARLHGEEQLYVSGYDDPSLDRWAERLRKWSSGQQCPDRLCIAAPMKDLRKRDVYVYFDNDVKVRAPFDAISLLERVTDFRPQSAIARPPAAVKRRKAA